jgi:acetyl esterase/lipase
MNIRVCVLLFTASLSPAFSADVITVWPGMAPGETTRHRGTVQPFRPDEHPRVTRVVGITEPTLSVHLAQRPTGAAAIILPGGGFGKVVPDKEGTEAAEWLNRHGVAAFVLSYRTSEEAQQPPWVEPLQDAQRSVALIRSRADTWMLDPTRIGIVAFSAGGQVGARLLCDEGKLAYPAMDDVDQTSHRPDFALLIYPWNLYDAAADALVDGMHVPPHCPPTWLAHTHDDRSSSLGAVYFYTGLKKHGIASALHVYGNGGHGYGLREVAGSQISSWTDHAAHWLVTQGIAVPAANTSQSEKTAGQ